MFKLGRSFAGIVVVVAGLSVGFPGVVVFGTGVVGVGVVVAGLIVR